MWQKFKKNKPAFLSLWVLVLLMFIAILAPFLANEKPLIVKVNGNYYFPVITPAKTLVINHATRLEKETIQFDVAEWKRIETDWVLWAPVSYSPGKSDLMNAGYVSPLANQQYKDADGKINMIGLKFRHWMGTGKRGDDILSGLIHGTYISLSIGIISMGIASVIGIFSGAVAGYFGDSGLSSRRSVILFSFFGLLCGLFYGFFKRKYILSDSLSDSFLIFSGELLLSVIICTVITFIFYRIGKNFVNISWFGLNKNISIPADSIINRTIELMTSMPRLILILSIASIAKPSVYILMIIIGATSWTGIARFVRAEFLRIRGLEYISAAKAMGFNDFRIIFLHALPNAFAPVSVTIAFGIATAILTESGLSFLGIGVPADVVTWGSLLNAGRENFDAWWLVIFPGFAIFITVTVYNLLGEGLRDAIDPRLKV